MTKYVVVRSGEDTDGRRGIRQSDKVVIGLLHRSMVFKELAPSPDPLSEAEEINSSMVLTRSWLFVPGHRQKMIDKSPGRGSDALIYDLEDAVPPDEMDAARRKVGAALDAAQEGPRRFVRIHGAGHVAKFIEELFSTTDTTDFVGSVRCTVPAGESCTGVAVELDAGNRIFTTLPVVPIGPEAAESSPPCRSCRFKADPPRLVGR